MSPIFEYIENNKALTFIFDTHLAETTTIIFAAASLIWAFLQWLKKHFADKRTPAFIKEKVEYSTRNYIKPDCIDEDPSRYHEIKDAKGKRKAIFPIVKKIIKPGSANKRVLILADSGMGKSSLLYAIYRKESRRLLGKIKVSLIELGSNNSIKSIPDITDKQNTILLLDALDENLDAMEDFEVTFAKIVQLCDEFYRVIITCRTQFFSHQSQLPTIQGFTGGVVPAGGLNSGTFLKIYLAPFTNKQIHLYLYKKYLRYFNIYGYYRSKNVVFKVKNISVRPMLLNYIDYLVAESMDFKWLYQIHQAMISGWLKRRKSDLVDVGYKNNLLFVHEIAKNMGGNFTKRKDFYIPKNEAFEIAKKLSVTILDWQITGRSLLNFDINNNLKFAHLSFLEVLLAREILNKNVALDWNPTDQMQEFLREMQLAERMGSNVDLFNADLSNVDLSHRNLDKIKLVYANLIGANLSNSKLNNIVARNASLEFVKLDNAVIDGSDFSNASLLGANMGGLKVENVNFSESLLKGANLSGSEFTNCDFTKASLFGALLTNTKFVKCTMHSVDFRQVRLEQTRGVDFRPNFIYSSTDNSIAPLDYAEMFLNFRGIGIKKDKIQCDVFNET